MADIAFSELSDIGSPVDKSFLARPGTGTEGVVSFTNIKSNILADVPAGSCELTRDGSDNLIAVSNEFHITKTGSRGVLKLPSNYAGKYLTLYMVNDEVNIATAGGSGLPIALNKLALGDVTLFGSSPEGTRRILKVTGWRTGSGVRKTLSISVEYTVNNQVDFRGIGYYAFFGGLKISEVKSGATQGAAGAVATEVWKTLGHASLPDNVLMIGV